MTADTPRFHIDEAVYLVAQREPRIRESSSERFVVVAIMPRDRAGSHQYRIRPAGAGPLRMATELELRPE